MRSTERPTGFNYAGKGGSQKHLTWSRRGSRERASKQRGDGMGCESWTRGENHTVPRKTRQHPQEIRVPINSQERSEKLLVFTPH